MLDPKDYEFRIHAFMLLGEGNPLWQEDTEFIKAFNKIRERTIVSPYRCYTLYQIAQQCNGLKGSFAQVGIYRGGSAKLIAEIKNPRKKMYLFDTFEGLPQPNTTVDLCEKGKFNDTSYEEVKEYVKDIPNLFIFKGIFPATAKNIQENETFAFVYLDVDLYESNYKALEYFYPKMEKGGIILFDDYDFGKYPGIKKSVEDFLKAKNAKEVPIRTAKYQAMIIKIEEKQC